MAKRDDILVPLSWDHHHGLRLSLILSKAFDSGERDADELRNLVLQRWEAEIRGHFEDEEALIELLPASIRSSSPLLGEFIERMLDEHRKIEGLVVELAQGGSLTDTLREFASDLKAHIRFEERQLFPELQEHLNDPDLRRQIADRLAQRREADGRARDGEDELLDVSAK